MTATVQPAVRGLDDLEEWVAPASPARATRRGSRLRRAPGPQPPRLRPPRLRPPRRPRAPEPASVTVVSSAMLVIAVLAGWSVVQVLMLGSLSHDRSQHELRADLREQLAAQTAPSGGVIEPGNPVAVLSIPALGIQEVVVEGTASGDTMSGPGHRRDTVLPGQQGVSIVYGRATTYGGPFRSLPTLRAGDGITITMAQGELVYRVDDVRRDGDPLPRPLATGGARLTLVTTEGSGALSALSGFRTVYVDATLVGDAVVGPAGRPAAIPPAEKAMSGDAGALPSLVLYLQGLLAAVVAASFLRGRVPARALWVVALPVLLVFTWMVTDAAARLLPNLL